MCFFKSSRQNIDNQKMHTGNKWCGRVFLEGVHLEPKRALKTKHMHIIGVQRTAFQINSHAHKKQSTKRGAEACTGVCSALWIYEINTAVMKMTGLRKLSTLVITDYLVIRRKCKRKAGCTHHSITWQMVLNLLQPLWGNSRERLHTSNEEKYWQDQTFLVMSFLF